MPNVDFRKILRTLTDCKVEFIIVGGVSAVLNGAPVNTFDLDVVHRRDPANIERLLGALNDLDAYYRMQFGRRLRPNASHLQSSGHHLLTTSSGDFDVLGTVGESLTYEDLLGQSELVTISEGCDVQVINLETLIKLKEELRRDKDLATLFVLRHTLEEKRRLTARTTPSTSDPSSETK